jgi:hypothetical protein
MRNESRWASGKLSDGKIPKLGIGDLVRVNAHTSSPDLKVVGILWRKVVVEWPRFGKKPSGAFFRVIASNGLRRRVVNNRPP